MTPFRKSQLPGRAAIISLSCLCLAIGLASTASAQDKGAPPWGEFLRRFEKDRLLKLPYYMAEETTPKGLASKIRARELDVPNRIRAIEYLASLDCAQFPEAKEMLIIALQNDQWERVRFAAAKGLREMIERNACGNGNGNGNGNGHGNCRECERQGSMGAWAKAKSYCMGAIDRAKGSGKHGSSGTSKKAERAAEAAEECRCRNCCDEETLNTLSEIAYGMDERGCHNEPSKRVRDMVIEAINVCGIECRYVPHVPTVIPVPVTPPIDPETQVPMLESIDATDGIEDGVPSEQLPPPPAESAQLPPLPKVTSRSEPVPPTPIDHLNKICIVSWRDGTRVKPNPEVTSVYKGRIYQFADENCKARFDASPEEFAVVFGGCDPVEFVKSREAVVGRYLVDHEGRFYMFATMENLDEFNAHPDAYTLSTPIVRASASE